MGSELEEKEDVEEKGEGIVDLASNGDEERQSSVVDSDSSPPSAWSTVDNDNDGNGCSSPDVVTVGEEEKTEQIEDGKKSEKEEGLKLSETEMMKERFAKLLLGEDMSGCGKGVCTALAISNAITNLGATLFGQLWRLEPLPSEKKLMWQREMDWLLCVSDHIVELVPNWQTFPDGSKLEVMTCTQRSDLFINLPALRKLDNMLLEILDSFSNTEFWYLDQGIQPPDSDGETSSYHSTHRQDEKWWLPVPHVPCGGLQDVTKKNLLHKRECTNQILKAAMAINDNALAEMEIPDTYLETLPKHGRTNLGEVIRKYITSEQFSPEYLLDCLDLSSEHQALEIANRVEASINVWHRTTHFKHHNHSSRHSHHMHSLGMVRELMLDGDHHKRELLAERAESLFICLKHRLPGLPQTALETSKIQYNQDVGKSILESYSRVLESIASNIVTRIDDLLYVDDLTRHSDNLTSMTKVSIVSQIKRVPVSCLPASTTPYATGFTPNGFSPSLT